MDDVIVDFVEDDDDTWPIKIESEWSIWELKSFDEHCIAICFVDMDGWCEGLFNSLWIIFNNSQFLELVNWFCLQGIVDEWSLK